MDLHDSKGRYWFGTDGDGAYMLDGNTWTHFTTDDGLPSGNVMTISESGDGLIWLGCRQGFEGSGPKGGLVSYDGQSIMAHSLAGLHHNNIHTTYADDEGMLWVGATGQGLYAYRDGQWTLTPEPSDYQHRESPYTDGVQSILKDSKGTLWVGYHSGLYRLEAGILQPVYKQGLMP